MKLLVAFAADDGKNLISDHFGMAKYFYIYRFFEGKDEFVERRENVKYIEDETIKHGDPNKAKATSSAVEGVDVIAGKRFGPNLTRLAKKFVCVITRVDTLAEAVNLVRDNIDKVESMKNKSGEMKYLVLKPN